MEPDCGRRLGLSIIRDMLDVCWPFLFIHTFNKDFFWFAVWAAALILQWGMASKMITSDLNEYFMPQKMHYCVFIFIKKTKNKKKTSALICGLSNLLSNSACVFYLFACLMQIAGIHFVTLPWSCSLGLRSACIFLNSKVPILYQK